MTLEEKIKELNTKLALKKAYSLVDISFKKDEFEIPEEVKEEVIKNIETFCEAMAERIDKEALSDPTSHQKSVQTEVKTSSNLNEVVKSNQNAQKEQPLKATLMTTDSLTREMKQLISSMTEVEITGLNPTHAVIQVKTKKGLKRISVPKEDLEINETQEDSNE